MDNNTDERKKIVKPWRDVVHIDHLTGSKGGEYWWLTLECGHHKSVAIPPYRYEFSVMASFGTKQKKAKRREAPHKCRCLQCGLLKEN